MSHDDVDVFFGVSRVSLEGGGGLEGDEDEEDGGPAVLPLGAAACEEEGEDPNLPIPRPRATGERNARFDATFRAVS